MTKVKQIISTLLIIAILGGVVMYRIDKKDRMDTYILEGKKALESGDYVSSLESFNQAVQLDSENEDALEGRLFALLAVGNRQPVKGVCATLERINPDKYSVACMTAKQGEFPWYIYEPANKDFVGKYRWETEYKVVLANPNDKVKSDSNFKAGVDSSSFAQYQDFNRYFLCDLDGNGVPELFLVADSPSGRSGEKTVFMYVFFHGKKDFRTIKNVEYIDPETSRLIGRGNPEDSADSYTTYKIVNANDRGILAIKRDTPQSYIERATPIDEIETFAITDTAPIDEYAQSLSSKRFM